MLSMSTQHILCKIVELASNEIFYATFVYAENKHTLRKVFFESMFDISRVKSKAPCVFLGDFNAIRYQQEKIGGNSKWTNDNEEFNTYVNASELVDLSYGGCQFTWANKRSEGAYIATKIDSPDFFSTVSNIWGHYFRGVPMFRVCQKLRKLKVSLKLLNKKDFSDISTRVQIAKANLDLIQYKLDKDPVNNGLQSQEREDLKKYIELSKLEESLALQKSRVQWLGLGDRNSKFFFRSVKSNINRGKILSVDMGDGTRSTNSSDIHTSFINFYTNLFGTPSVDQYNGFERIQSLEWISSTPSSLLPSPGSSDTPVWSLTDDEVVTTSIIQMVRGRLLSMENVKTSAGDNWFLEKWNLPYKIMQQHHAIADGRRMSGSSVLSYSYQVMMNPKSSPKLKWLNRGLSDVSKKSISIHCGLSDVFGAIKYTVYLVLLRNHGSCEPSDVRFYMEWSDIMYCGSSVGRSYIVCLLFLLLYDVCYGVGSFNLWHIRQVYLLVRSCGVFSYSAVTVGCCQWVYLMEWRGSDCLLHRFERQLDGCVCSAVMAAISALLGYMREKISCLFLLFLHNFIVYFAYPYGLCRMTSVHLGVLCNRLGLHWSLHMAPWMPTPTGCVGRNGCCGGAMLDAGYLFVQSPYPLQDMAFVQTNGLAPILFFLEFQM
ncbi:hypothetical protein ACSBR1_017963 [Camellia fascicularis]